MPVIADDRVDVEGPEVAGVAEGDDPATGVGVRSRVSAAAVAANAARAGRETVAANAPSDATTLPRRRRRGPRAPSSPGCPEVRRDPVRAVQRRRARAASCCSVRATVKSVGRGNVDLKTFTDCWPGVDMCDGASAPILVESESQLVCQLLRRVLRQPSCQPWPAAATTTGQPCRARWGRRASSRWRRRSGGWRRVVTG